jgi:hypothetical protein
MLTLDEIENMTEEEIEEVVQHNKEVLRQARARREDDQV